MDHLAEWMAANDAKKLVPFIKAAIRGNYGKRFIPRKTTDFHLEVTPENKLLDRSARSARRVKAVAFTVGLEENHRLSQR